MRLIYSLVAPDDATMNKGENQGKDLDQQGLVNGGQPSVKSVRSNPRQIPFEGRYTGKLAETMKQELVELASNNEIDVVTIYEANRNSTEIENPENGYYSIESVDVRQPNDYVKSYYNWTLQTVRQGSPKSHWRATTLELVDATSDNPYSTATSDYPAWFHAGVSEVKAADLSTGEIENTSLYTTAYSKYNILQAHDVADQTIADVTYYYNLPFQYEAEVDPKLWDKAGNADKSDSQVNNLWQRVFDTGHKFTDDMVLENGRLRFGINQDGTGSIDEWDNGTSSYSTNLQTFDSNLGVTIHDVDIMFISDDYIEMQITWDGDTSGLTFGNHILTRGINRLYTYVPENWGGFTTEVENALEPVSSTTDSFVLPNTKIVRREDIRR